jgi:hypothetical protein
MITFHPGAGDVLSIESDGKFGRPTIWNNVKSVYGVYATPFGLASCTAELGTSLYHVPPSQVPPAPT